MEQTIEIKTLTTTKRADGIDTRLKSARKQSGNILFDITDSSLSKDSVIERAEECFLKNEWMKVIIIKNGSSYIVYGK